MITYYFRAVKDESLVEIPEHRSGAWIHVVDPSNKDLELLATDFNLDIDIMRDAKDFYEVPRMERVQDATYFFTRYPFEDTKRDNTTAPILIVVGENFVLTITIREIPQFKRIISGKEVVFTTQKSKVFIQMMNLITRSFDRELLRLQKAVHRDRVQLRRIGTKEIERLVSYETSLNSIVDSLVPTNSWLQKVTAGNFMQFYKDDIEMMEDLVIANGQSVNSARSVLTTIQNIRGSIEAIMTSRLNNTLQILTVLTILLTIPLLISSLFGMNVDLPLQDSPHAFAFIILFNIALLGILVIIFRKKHWF
jgi:magnesium transporter